MAVDGPAEVQNVHPSFVLRLILALRSRGLMISPVEAAQASQLIAGETFTNTQLAEVLRAQFARRPGDVAIFDTEYERLTASMHTGLRDISSSPPPKTPTIPSPKSPSAITRWLGYSQNAWRKLLQRVAAIQFGWWLAAFAGIVLILLYNIPSDPTDICKLIVECPGIPPSNVISVVSVLKAAAFALVSIPAVIWLRQRFFGSTRPDPNPGSGIITGEGPGDQAGANDGTSFRVTVLGGPPPGFLDRTRATQIVEAIGYRDAGEDQIRIDLRMTIDRLVRGGDSAAISAARRRELPLLMLITDNSTPARFYNTLANEFETVLRARGVACERIRFAGSFHSHDSRPQTAAREIRQLIDAPGWQVACVFGEVQRLSDLDRNFLVQAAEHGPVLFLDYRDPLLWDIRHRRFTAMHANIILEPATGPGLQAGIARIFTPGREPPPYQQGEHPAAGLKAWMEECALVEPMSYPLAEKLRQRHAKDDRSILAYSLAVAQPGSWLGPEGLRYGPTQRCQLLDAFARRPESERRAALAIINDAFDRVLAHGATAQAIKDYARAQANIFALDSDEEAIATLLRAEQEGHVDPMAVKDFRSRLRFGKIAYEAGAIRLPGEPSRAEYRARLFDQMVDSVDPAIKDINTARWGIGAPQVRVALEMGGGDSKRPQAAFMAGSQLLLIAAEDASGTSALRFFQVTHGIETRIIMPPNPGKVTGLWVARGAPVAVVAFGDRALFWLRAAPDQADDPAAFRLEPIKLEMEFGRDLVVALDHAGERLVYVSGPSGPDLALIDRDGRTKKLRLAVSGRIVALIWLEEDRFLFGLASGEIYGADLSSASDLIEKDHLMTTGGMPASFALLRDGSELRGIAVALSSGRIELHISNGQVDAPSYELSSAFQVTSVPRGMVFLADSPAANVRRDGAAMDNGYSLATLSEHGRFDVLGFPQTPFPAPGDQSTSPMFSSFTPMALAARHPLTHGDNAGVIAFSTASRRIAAWRDGRLEIRPLLYEKPVPLEPIEATEKMIPEFAASDAESAISANPTPETTSGNSDGGRQGATESTENTNKPAKSTQRVKRPKATSANPDFERQGQAESAAREDEPVKSKAKGKRPKATSANPNFARRGQTESAPGAGEPGKSESKVKRPNSLSPKKRAAKKRAMKK